MTGPTTLCPTRPVAVLGLLVAMLLTPVAGVAAPEGRLTWAVQAETLGFSKITGSIIPRAFDFYWQPSPWPYDAARATQLPAEAGYPGGFDAGECPRVEESGLGLIAGHAYSAPYEDLRVRK